MATHTVTLPAWVTSDYAMDQLRRAREADEIRAAVGSMSFPIHDMSDVPGWVCVGTAQITVEIMPDATLHNRQLETLQAELQSVRAENQRRENAILDRISKLQAITCEVVV